MRELDEQAGQEAETFREKDDANMRQKNESAKTTRLCLAIDPVFSTHLGTRRSSLSLSFLGLELLRKVQQGPVSLLSDQRSRWLLSRLLSQLE